MNNTVVLMTTDFDDERKCILTVAYDWGGDGRWVGGLGLGDEWWLLSRPFLHVEIFINTCISGV